MTDQLPEHLEWMLHGFVGYGRMEAGVWLVGMEERCRDDDDARARLEKLPTFGRAEGMSAAHRAFGWEAIPDDVVVWEVARRVGAECGFPDAVGEANGDILFAELLPLPRPGNAPSVWPAAYESLFRGYRDYVSALLTMRARRLAELVREHAPRAVVIHGQRYHPVVQGELRRVAGAPRNEPLQLGKKRAVVWDVGETTVLFVHNLAKTAGWSETGKEALAQAIIAIRSGLALSRYSGRTTHSALAGMFMNRSASVIPRAIAERMPGLSVRAPRPSVRNLVGTSEFRVWATTHAAPVGGRTPLELCVSRDLADLAESNAARRLKTRYGAESVAEIRVAVAQAHRLVLEWAAQPDA